MYIYRSYTWCVYEYCYKKYHILIYTYTILYVAHGESIIRDGRHIHQFNPIEAPKYNISHTIHTLSFGDKVYAHMPPNPLDGGKSVLVYLAMTYSLYLRMYFIYTVHHTDTHNSRYTIYTHFHSICNTVSSIVDPAVGTGLYQYFVKVIPVVYTDHRGRAKVSSRVFALSTIRHMCILLPIHMCRISYTRIFSRFPKLILICPCIQVTNEYTASQKFRPYAIIDHESGKLVPLVRIMTFI